MLSFTASFCYEFSRCFVKSAEKHEEFMTKMTKVCSILFNPFFCNSPLEEKMIWDSSKKLRHWAEVEMTFSLRKCASWEFLFGQQNCLFNVTFKCVFWCGCSKNNKKSGTTSYPLCAQWNMCFTFTSKMGQFKKTFQCGHSKMHEEQKHFHILKAV